MKNSKCKHLSVKYLGIQETLDTSKSLALYNCQKCHSTISVPVIQVSRNRRKADEMASVLSQ